MPTLLHFFSASSGHFSESFVMLYVRSLFDLPLKGRRPNVSSYAQTPNDHQSIWQVYPRFVRILWSIMSGDNQLGVISIYSGAMYAIDPATPVKRRSLKWIAILKSVKWAFPRSSSKMLSGLRSLERNKNVGMSCKKRGNESWAHRCMIPISCKKARADDNWAR